MPNKILDSGMKVIFNHDFEPISWDGDWSDLISTDKEESKDIRKLIPFLYSSEKVLIDLIDDTIEHWEIDNIAIKNKNYFALLIKKSSNSFALTILDNSIGILEKKIIKQKLILEDPFHWTKSDKKNDEASSLNFLTSLVDSLSDPTQDMEHTIYKIKVDATDAQKHDLEILGLQLGQVQSVIEMAKKYLSHNKK